MESRAWVGLLTDDERRALREIEDWVHKPPGAVGRTMAMLGKPLDFAYQRLPSALKEGMSEKVVGVLSAVRENSRRSFDQQELLDRLSAAVGRDITHPEQLFDHDFRPLDRIAKDILKKHRRAALLEGGAAGAAGLPGLVLDVPALYWLIFRTVQQIAICYGFEVSKEPEIAHIFKVVDVGHHLESDKKRRGMLELESLQSLIRQGVTLQDLERTFLAKGLQALARQLTASLAKRKLAQSVAVVGALVGASVNRQLVADVGLTAVYAYRRRFLREIAYRRESGA